MADKKISALTGATTPLAGSEVLPIVQGGSTVKVSVDNLTAGKSVSASAFVPTGSTVPANGMYLDTTNSVSIANNSARTATIRSGGIMGLGTTPQSWYLPGDVISAQQVGANTVTMSLFGNQSHFGSNFYLKTGTGNDTYINTGVAMRYRQDGGAHVFESAPSGTADTNLTFTPLATVAANGNFTVHTNNVVIGTAGKGIQGTGGNSATTAATVSAGGYIDIPINSTGFVGTLSVSSTRFNYEPQSRRTVFAVACYGSTMTTTQLHSQDGSGGGASFSLSVVGGAIRITDTSGSGSAMTMYAAFSGAFSYGS